VQDAFTFGGAQRAGSTTTRSFQIASDVDYVRGINSWRAGALIYADWYHSDTRSNYLGTYTFTSVDAYNAGLPAVYSRQIGDPVINYSNAHGGIYLQDDLRIHKGLTLSPGVRYSAQSIVDDHEAIEPRFGVTWSPWKNGKTTLRASAGTFHGWLAEGVLLQTLRFDGVQQRELLMTNPSYPDPGTEGSVIPPTNIYQLGHYQLNKNIRYSAGIDEKFSPKFTVNVLFNYFHQEQLPRGENLNPIVNGVRLDPSLGNVIATVTDAEIIRHELYVNFSLNLAPGAPPQNRRAFDWRRVNANGNYAFIRARRNAMGAFDPPPSGALANEWGNGPADTPGYFYGSLNSTQFKNVAINVNGFYSSGNVYNWTTGTDDNHDGIINDRPDGVGINTLRGASYYSLNVRFSYTLPLTAQPVQAAGSGGPAAQARYRPTIFAQINNLTNHYNYYGYSGVQTSPFFRQPTTVFGTRSVTIGMNFNF
jgi:hypothetical protein